MRVSGFNGGRRGGMPLILEDWRKYRELLPVNIWPNLEFESLIQICKTGSRCLEVARASQRDCLDNPDCRILEGLGIERRYYGQCVKINPFILLM